MKRILVVDDHEYVLEKFHRYCAGYDAEFIAVLCNSAIDAIRAIRTYEPDILFLDYSFYDNANNEETTGKEVASWIDHSYIKPIMVATHTAREEEEARQLFSGCKCVTHFVEQNEKLCQKFLEDSQCLKKESMKGV